jgi:hypothetical protein
MGRNLGSRVTRLEREAGRVLAPARRLRTQSEWLKVFEDQGRHGFFDGEPDFAVALEAFRQAVAEKPDATRVPGEWWWLGEMVERVSHGRPGVTEGEFIELAA